VDGIDQDHAQCYACCHRISYSYENGSYLQKCSGIRLFERLYAELKQACRVLEFAGTCGYLVLQCSQLHLLVLPDEVEQFMFTSVDCLYQSVTLRRYLILEIRAVLLKATNTS
jgi:hypothetical protein